MVLSESDWLFACDFESKLLQTKIRGGNDYSYHVIWVAEQMTRDQIYLLIISGTLEPFSAYMSSFRITIPNPIANTQKICVRYQWPTKTSAHFQKNIRIGFGGLTKPSRRTFMTSVWCRLQFFIPRQILFHLIRWNNTNDIPEKYHNYFFCLGKEILLVRN